MRSRPPSPSCRRPHPEVAFTQIIDTVDETRLSYEATTHVLVEGMVLAALVVFLFLKSWRATAIAAVAMPLSLIPTFSAVKLFGFNLDSISLLSLTLVIGILVDDAIVEIENIEKRIERGETPYRASLIGADSIGLAVVATTATIVVVFTPVSFMGGISGPVLQGVRADGGGGGALLAGGGAPAHPAAGRLFPQATRPSAPQEAARRRLPRLAGLGAAPPLDRRGRGPADLRGLR